MSLEERFKDAAGKIKAVPANKTSNDEKLKLYGLYKQAQVGNCTTPQPSVLQLEGKAKWDAWKTLDGTSKEDAMTQYVAEAERQLTAHT